MAPLATTLAEDNCTSRCITFLLQVPLRESDDFPSGAPTRYRHLVAALRAQTPPDAVLLTGTPSILVLYDNQALSATVLRLPIRTYRVTVDRAARKLKVLSPVWIPDAFGTTYRHRPSFTGKKITISAI